MHVAGWQVFKQLLRQSRNSETSAASNNGGEAAGFLGVSCSSQSSEATTDHTGKAIQEQLRKLKLQVSLDHDAAWCSCM
jgi:hypothetical protein